VEFYHKPVLLAECLEYLNIRPDGVYVDCTLGGGGHALEICRRLTTGRLIGTDADADALAHAGQALRGFAGKITLIHENFSNIDAIFGKINIDKADGFLADLGVSSHQLDDAARGFSYMQDAPLDMRLDQSRGFTAYDVVNGYGADQLARVIRDYGEERWAARIAEFIADERRERPIKTTLELVSVIKKAVPKAARKDGPHPAKRAFQAIRIEVNNELGILESSIRKMCGLLNPGGRLCVITFHSLEDRLVKNTFRSLEHPCECPPGLPCVCGKQPAAEVLTRKAVKPSEAETAENPRARSAKLRAVRRL